MENIDQYLALLRDLIRHHPERLDLMDRYERLLGFPAVEAVEIDWPSRTTSLFDVEPEEEEPVRPLATGVEFFPAPVPEEVVAEAAASLQEHEVKAWEEMVAAAEQVNVEIPITTGRRLGVCPKCGHGFRSFEHRACREATAAPAPTDEELDAIVEPIESPTEAVMAAESAARAAVRARAREMEEATFSRPVEVPDVLGPIIDSELPYSHDPARYSPGDDCPKCQGRRQMRHDNDPTDAGPYCMACGFRPRKTPVADMLLASEDGGRRRSSSHAGIKL